MRTPDQRSIDTAGGAYYAGTIQTSGSDSVGRDQKETVSVGGLEIAELSKHRILGSIVSGVDGESVHDTMPTQNCYFFFTNVTHEFFQSDEPWTLADRLFREKLGLPISIDFDFGIGTPETMCQGAPYATEQCLVELLNLCSNYYIVAREGKVSVVPTIHRGQYFASPRGAAFTDQDTPPLGAAVTYGPSDLRLPNNSAISDFEALLNLPSNKEQDIQRFLEENPEFFFALDERYTEIRPHICLVDCGDTQLVPDFMARVEDTDIWDIIELKLPQHRAVVETSNQTRASAVAARAIAQVLRYRDYFSTRQNRHRFQKRYGFSPYEPCLVVVIGRGRLRHIYEWKSTHPLFPKVKVVSYDFMVDEARRLQKELARLRGDIASSGEPRRSR